MKAAALLSLVISAYGFVPRSRPRSNTLARQETKVRRRIFEVASSLIFLTSPQQEDLEVLAKKLNPSIRFYDPLNLAEWNFWGVSEEARIGFLRHSEIKHGRIAMFAFVGYIAHANGIKFPWPMQLDGTGFPDELNPPLLWDKIPDAAKWQIIGFIGFLEYWSELSTPEHIHYMMPGGKPGEYPDFLVGKDAIPHPVGFNLYDPLKLWKNRSEEDKARGLLVEINNGRAAMFGILGFLSSQSVPGSVPLLNKVLPAYYGEVMIPFENPVLP